LIGTLFFHRCPPEVVWFVIAIGIYSVDRLSKGTLADVGKEDGEIMPSLTNGNSATPVVLKVCGIFLVATCMHSLPNIIKGMSFGTAARVPMGSALPTSTGSLALAKMSLDDSTRCSAIAETSPHFLSAAVCADGLNGRELSETQASNFLEVTHGGLRERQLWLVAGMTRPTSSRHAFC
jgi:hypothetical protein